MYDGLADREHSGRPDVIPSRHEDVWDYGGAAGTGPGPSQSVLCRDSGTSGTRVRLSPGKRWAGRPHGWRWCQLALRLSRQGQIVRGVHAGRHLCDRRARRRRRDEGSRRGVRGGRTPETQTVDGVARMPGWRRGGVVQELGRRPGRVVPPERISQEESWPVFDAAAGSCGRARWFVAVSASGALNQTPARKSAPSMTSAAAARPTKPPARIAASRRIQKSQFGLMADSTGIPSLMIKLTKRVEKLRSTLRAASGQTGRRVRSGQSAGISEVAR